METHFLDVRRSYRVLLDRWAKKYDFCVECGSQNNRHHGNGLCRKCREKKRWLLSKQRIQVTLHFRCEVCGQVFDTGVLPENINTELENWKHNHIKQYHTR